LQTCRRDAFFGSAVETRAIGPADPGFPDLRNDASDCPLRAHIFQEPDQAARLHNPAKLTQSRQLQLIGQHAEKKCRDRGIESRVRKIEPGDVHLLQLDQRWR